MKKTPNLDEAVARGRGIERPFQCDVHEDSNASACVNVLKGVWICYACGASGRVGTGSVTVEMKALLDFMESPENVPVKTINWLNIFDAAGPSPYWAQRYGQRVSDMFRCGTHPETGNPTYPIHSPFGNIWGVVQRADDGEHKYLYPLNVPVSQTLFNYSPRWAGVKRVVVVEGASDVMAMYATRLGKEKRHTLIVGSYGAGLKKPQVDLINDLRPEEVVLAFDNDMAGFAAAHREYELQAKVRIHTWPDTIKDAGEATPAMRRKVLQS